MQKFADSILGECLGWAARAGAHHCPYNKTLFSLQISILIICMHTPRATFLGSDGYSTMLLQRRHLLHPRPDDHAIRPPLQSHLGTNVPCHFRIL